MRALASVTLALLLAGCLGTADAPVETAALAGNATASGDTPALASEVGASASPPSDQNATVDVPVDLEGKTGTSFCLPAGPNTCVGPGLSLGDPVTHFELDLPGAPVSGTLVLTWEALTPATRTMSLSFAATTRSDGGWSARHLAWAEGASPLELSSDELLLEPGEVLSIEVGLPCTHVPPLLTCNDVEQTFTVAGNMVAVAS